MRASKRLMRDSASVAFVEGTWGRCEAEPSHNIISETAGAKIFMIWWERIKKNPNEQNKCREFNKNYNKSNEKMKSVEDYCFCIVSVILASDYDVNSQLIIDFIKKTYTRDNYTSEALWASNDPNVEKWEPLLK